MRRTVEHHSRFDFPNEPPKANWWHKLRHQARLQLLLTFYPHPDSVFYPQRKRVLLSAILVFVGAIVLGYYWRHEKRAIPHYEVNLLILALLGLGMWLKSQFNLIPRLKDAFLYPIFLWLCLPVFFFLDYFLLAGGRPSVAHLCIMLLLYTNVLHWRVGFLGALVAIPVAWGLAWSMHPVPFTPRVDDLLAIAIALTGGAFSSYTFAHSDSARYAQNARVMRLVGKRLHSALGVQLALSEGLRHEAQSLKDTNSRQRLLELIERLDSRADLTRAQLQELEKDVDMHGMGGIHLLKIDAICSGILQELEVAYAWPAAWLNQFLICQKQDELLLQGERDEVVQFLASVIALLLRNESIAGKGQQARGGHLLMRWDNTMQGQLRLSLASDGDAAAWKVLDAQEAKHKAREHLVLARELLPAYSVYVMQKMGVRLFFGSLENGRPVSVRVLWPKPDLLKSRLTGHQTLSLVQMYGNQWS